ncbi:MAG: nucleotidyltransferase family protein [Chloroflexi bacterium]|nr:nucleotidyltransferase family protein [Chloroflexota bacterium]
MLQRDAMMSVDDVINILDRLDTSGVCVWLDGGWVVDALLGRQTRHHRDLDVVIDRQDLVRAQAALEPLGFRHATGARPGLPARLVLRDARGRQLDFHPVVFDAAGDGWQELGDGTWGRYPAVGLAGGGTIAGRPVRCITPELQLQHHLGHESDAIDRHGMRLLAERF